MQEARLRLRVERVGVSDIKVEVGGVEDRSSMVAPPSEHARSTSSSAKVILARGHEEVGHARRDTWHGTKASSDGSMRASMRFSSLLAEASQLGQNGTRAGH